MASPEEAYEDLVALPETASPSLSAELQWQPGRSVLVHETPVDHSDWISLLLGLLGRRPAARRPALTAQA